MLETIIVEFSIVGEIVIYRSPGNMEVVAVDSATTILEDARAVEPKSAMIISIVAQGVSSSTLDPAMQEQIEKTLSAGNASYETALSARYMDIWEQAVLAIKREGYSIKCNGPRGIVVTEKFLPTTAIGIPYGHPTEFSIQCSNGAEYLLRTRDSWLRDTVVLTMRLFKKMAVEKKKGRKKHLFFK